MSHLRRPSWIALAMLLCVPFSAMAQQDISGGGFYPFRGSARTIGLAGAYTAIADDTAGLLFNPAGMAQINQRQGSVDLKVNADGENYFRLAYVEPVRSNKVGGGLNFFRASDGTGRSDKVYQFTYGQMFQQGLAFGASVRYQEVTAPGAKDEGFAFDLGLLYRPPTEPKWRFGLAVLNVNEPRFSGIGLGKRTYNVGIAFDLDEFTTFDLDWYDIGSQAKRGQLRFGGERLLTENIAVRAGVAEDTFGVGLSLRYQYFTLDYGFQRVDNGPDINLLSLLANF